MTVHRESSGRLSKSLATPHGSAASIFCTSANGSSSVLPKRRDEPPESHSTHNQAELGALVSSSLMGWLWRSKRTPVTRATPADCEQAQAQTMGGGLGAVSVQPAQITCPR